MKITLNGYQETPFEEFLSEGDYNAEVIEASPHKASTGTEFLMVVFRVLDGPEKDRTVVSNYYLTQKAYWRLQSLLNAISVRVSDTSEVETAQMLGQTLRIRVSEIKGENGYPAKSEVVKTMRLDAFQVTDRDLLF
jgi:hypothetical protein